MVTVCVLFDKLITFAITQKTTMKKALLVLVFCSLPATALLAQLPTDSPVDVLRHPDGWNKTVFAGGGTSVASTPSGQNLVLGLRMSRVITEEHGPGILRGTFEVGFDVIPLNEYWIKGGQYSGGVDPVMLKWNFTNCCKMAPYFALVAGVLFSPNNLPPPNTAQVNFDSGAEIGLQMFRHERNSVDLSMKAYHLSNASIGNHNPGLNANLQFMIGYTWR